MSLEENDLCKANEKAEIENPESTKERDPEIVRVNRLYGRDYDFGFREEAPTLRYMIATMPRSGSTLFSMTLWRTGSLGAPMEYLNLPNHDSNIQKLGNGNLEDYWNSIISRRTSSNGVFGFKAFVANLRQVAAISPALLSQTGVDRVIFLTRRDRAAHAVSYARAMATKSWFYGTREQSDWRYNFEDIARAERWIISQENTWKKMFDDLDVKPLAIVYEDFLKDKAETVQSVIDWLGVPLIPAQFHVPLLKKQSDEASREWALRYSEERDSRMIEDNLEGSPVDEGEVT